MTPTELEALVARLQTYECTSDFDSTCGLLFAQAASALEAMGAELEAYREANAKLDATWRKFEKTGYEILAERDRAVEELRRVSAIGLKDMAEIDSLRLQVEARENQIDKLISDHSDCEQAYLKVEAEHDALRDRISLLEVCFEAGEKNVDSLRLQVEALRKERDDWAAKWHKVRAELAELKYPGMKGEVRAAMGEPTGKDLK